MDRNPLDVLRGRKIICEDENPVITRDAILIILAQALREGKHIVIPDTRKQYHLEKDDAEVRTYCAVEEGY